MKTSPTALPDVLLIEPAAFADERGYFMETYQAERYAPLGLPPFVQDNVSFSVRGTLRGLHFQHPRAQGKLVYVLQGEVFDVAVDIRPQSPTYSQWVGMTLSAANRRQLYIPPGFAHGFCVTSADALFVYKCTDYYHPASEGGIIWNDPDLRIAWPIAAPLLSAKDRLSPTLKQLHR